MLTPIVHTGNCLDHMLGVIEPHSVHCIVSSPPYWGLRDYGIPGTLWRDGWTGVYGNEPSISQYLDHTIELFDAMRYVLRPDGVIWWNIGDSYRPDGGKGMCPHRVAIALQDAGWCIRQDNIWSKPAPMPESISGWHWTRCRVKVAPAKVARMGDPGTTGHRAYMLGGGQTPEELRGLAQWSDCPGCPKCEVNGGYVLRRGKWRNTTGHEYIFQITQGNDYFCDATAAAETAVGGSPGNKNHKGATAYAEGDKHHRTKVGLSPMVASTTRNPRSVWHFAAESFKGAHFATFPTELPYRCIKASTSPAGCCPHCGSQWAPVIAKVRRPTRPGNETKVGRVTTHGEASPYFHQNGSVVGNRDPLRHVTETVVSEYRQTCSCPTHSPVPATVYDPFGGSLTTAAVAAHMGRQAITSEINPTYIGLGDARLTRRPKALADRDPKKPRKPRKKKHHHCQLLLLEANGS